MLKLYMANILIVANKFDRCVKLTYVSVAFPNEPSNSASLLIFSINTFDSSTAFSFKHETITAKYNSDIDSLGVEVSSVSAVLIH